MPLLSPLAFRSPILQFNGQLQTVLPGMFRKPSVPNYDRERLELSDGDFVDLDWIKKGNRTLVILSHGLEGNSQRPYIKGMAAYASKNNLDVLAWNCRSCSEEMNRNRRLYHHGEIHDIHEVIMHALASGAYEKIWLMGFSMGGNISLNYLCKMGEAIPPQLQGMVACSSPLHMEHSVLTLETSAGRFYKKRFFKMLSVKIKAKAEQFPGWINLDKLKDVKEWKDFDRWFSAPMNGFADEYEFYQQASPIFALENLRHPALLVNALNDPILAGDCYPESLAKDHKYFHLMLPENGGHVGFSQRGKGVSWFEELALGFIFS